MAYEFNIDPDVKYVFVRHFGEYQTDEEQRQIEAIFSDARYQTGYNILRDDCST